MLACYIIVLLINLINMMFNIKSKFVVIVSLLFLYILMWGNSLNPDYIGYQMLYDGVTTYNVEPGFRFILYAFKKMGFSYQSFLMVMGFISFILVGRTARRYADNYSIIFALYLMSAFVMDTIIIRNTFALAVVIFALPYYSQGKKIKYILSIIVASLIHISMLIFLVPIIISKKSISKKSIKYSGLLVLLIIVFSILIWSFGDNIYNVMAPWVTSLKIRNISAYGITGNIGFGFFLYLGLWICNIVSVFYARKYYRFYSNSAYTNEVGALIDVIVMLNVISGIFLPLASFNSNYYRVIMNMILPNLVVFSAVFNKKLPNYCDTKSPQIDIRRLAHWKQSMLILFACFIPWFINEISGITFSFTLFLEIINNSIFK